MSTDPTCNESKTPVGWHCTRTLGHGGPCAAWPHEPDPMARLETVLALLDDLTREWIQYDYSPWNGPSICHWCSAPVTYGKPGWSDRPAIPDSAVHADDCPYVRARAVLGDSP